MVIINVKPKFWVGALCCARESMSAYCLETCHISIVITSGGQNSEVMLCATDQPQTWANLKDLEGSHAAWKTGGTLDF